MKRDTEVNVESEEFQQGAGMGDTRFKTQICRSENRKMFVRDKARKPTNHPGGTVYVLWVNERFTALIEDKNLPIFAPAYLRFKSSVSHSRALLKFLTFHIYFRVPPLPRPFSPFVLGVN